MKRRKDRVDIAQSTKYVNELGEEKWSAEWIHNGGTARVQAEPPLFCRGTIDFVMNPEPWRVVKYDSESEALKAAETHIEDYLRNTWGRA